MCKVYIVSKNRTVQHQKQNKEKEVKQHIHYPSLHKKNVSKLVKKEGLPFYAVKPCPVVRAVGQIQV